MHHTRLPVVARFVINFCIHNATPPEPQSDTGSPHSASIMSPPPALLPRPHTLKSTAVLVAYVSSNHKLSPSYSTYHWIRPSTTTPRHSTAFYLRPTLHPPAKSSGSASSRNSPTKTIYKLGKQTIALESFSLSIQRELPNLLRLPFYNIY